MTAAQRWATELAAWAIPDEILAAASENPWRLPPAAFRADPPGTVAAADALTPSRRAALEALPSGGSVLDVGCGAGAASLTLVPPAGHVTGVDASAEMLAAFATDASARGASYDVVQGRWPEVAPRVAPADVVVCHHVAYNVPDLAGFALALSSHARRRVVLELTGRHPLVDLAPLWRRFHGLERPSGPDAALARTVLEEAGLQVHAEALDRPRTGLPVAERVALTRRRLCLPAHRDAEVADALAELGPPQPRRVFTFWWEPQP